MKYLLYKDTTEPLTGRGAVSEQGNDRKKKKERNPGGPSTPVTGPDGEVVYFHDPTMGLKKKRDTSGDGTPADGMRSMDDLDRDEIKGLCVDFVHRIFSHDDMWRKQVERRLGHVKMCGILSQVRPRSRDIQIRRLVTILGEDALRKAPMPNGELEWHNVLPSFEDLSDERLREFLEGLAINWLAQDGVWFQGVEFSHGMDAAKECNDACWAEFSPHEAWMIRKLVKLEERPGLGGLKRALGYRLYAAINRQSIHDEGEGAFIFRMDECRVQAARKRKGLADYPCKSGGTVEYTTFAREIDDRIGTECIACPPDEHPDEWFCAWRFSIE